MIAQKKSKKKKLTVQVKSMKSPATVLASAFPMTELIDEKVPPRFPGGPVAVGEPSRKQEKKKLKLQKKAEKKKEKLKKEICQLHKL